jgi:putative flippase GtrA
MASMVRAAEVRAFAAIGALSTLAYIGCYSALSLALPAAAASGVALLLTTIANTAANRRFTFKGAGRGNALRGQAGGLVALAVALCLTTIALSGLHLVAPRAGRPAELAVLAAANLLATAVRFTALRAAAAGWPAWAPAARSPAAMVMESAQAPSAP